MNKATDQTESKLPRKDGMTVPDGYFADFASRMAASLPERPEIEGRDGGSEPSSRTVWQRIRPYVYMAAMFGGVWLMLKLFTMLTATTPVPFDSNPIVAEALSNDTFVNEYIISDLNQWDLYDDLIEEGINPDSFLDSIAFAQMDVPSDFLN